MFHSPLHQKNVGVSGVGGIFDPQTLIHPHRREINLGTLTPTTLPLPLTTHHTHTHPSPIYAHPPPTHSPRPADHPSPTHMTPTPPLPCSMLHSHHKLKFPAHFPNFITKFSSARSSIAKWDQLNVKMLFS